MPHPPRPKGTSANTEHNKPCGKKYHIEFGAAKCKVVKIGKGPKSNILLNNQVLEEVEAYKYLGEVFNNKGNMEAHIKAIEGKIHAATQNIITETGNKEFKGMKMQAIRQMVEATIIPIPTYEAEGWALTQNEEQQIQPVLNKSLKTILALPTTTPNNILIAETGFLPIKYLINRKKIMQAPRLENKEGNLAKRLTKEASSIWRKETLEITNQYDLKEEHLNMSKEMLKKILDLTNQHLFSKEMQNEALAKSKTKHWLDMKHQQEAKRPQYMNKITRTQCSAIARARTQMIAAKANHKNQYGEHLQCRYCNKDEETQEHILTKCTHLHTKGPKIGYRDLFQDQDLEKLRTAAVHIIDIEKRTEGATSP